MYQIHKCFAIVVLQFSKPSHNVSFLEFRLYHNDFYDISLGQQISENLLFIINFNLENSCEKVNI